jgi:hypothetical protein
MNKNAIYLLRQPKHIILTMIYVGKEYPKSKVVHDSIDLLAKDTDVFFIFDSRQTGINQDKFTSLYNGMGYIVSSKNSGEAMFDVLEYSREIWKTYISYLVLEDWNISSLSEISRVNSESIIWTANTIASPIMNIYRKSPEDLYSMYKIKYKKTWWGGYKEIEDSNNQYATHSSKSDVLFFKDIIVTKWLENPNISKYLNTFKGSSIKDVVASLIMDMGINYLEKVKLNNNGKL